jgi:hypothetical protein
MENIQITLNVALGFFIRLAIPASLMALIIYLLSKLDEHWKAESRLTTESSGPRPCNPGCWKYKNCSEEDKAKCKAFAHSETPCWQVKRAPTGLLQEQCLVCNMFTNAMPLTLS